MLVTETTGIKLLPKIIVLNPKDGLLSKVGEILKEAGYQIGNVDATVIAQRPKLAPYREQMRVNMARALSVDASQISVKATTEEGLGFTGAGEGISAQAVALLI